MEKVMLVWYVMKLKDFPFLSIFFYNLQKISNDIDYESDLQIHQSNPKICQTKVDLDSISLNISKIPFYFMKGI